MVASLPVVLSFIVVGSLLLPVCGSAGVLEEVVVTAQKREQSLQDVPISVSTMAGDQVDAKYIMSLEQLTEYMPNVVITDTTAGEQLFIRGLGSGANEGFEQSVGTYVDGVYYGRGRSAKTGFLDLARVEVLKGPQGVLFGKNTIAGAINITTRNPTDEFEAGVKLGYEIEHEEKILEASISGPITDNFGARLAIRGSDHDGWMKNTYLDQSSGEIQEVAARLTTVWQVSEAVDAVVKIQYTDMEAGERPGQLSDCSEAMRAIVAGVDDCRFDDETTMALIGTGGAEHGFENYKSLSAGLTVNWEFENLTLTSVTGYTELEDEHALELDFTHLDILSADPRNEDFDSLSQELRLASALGKPLEYVVGVYYEKTDLKRSNNFNLPTLTRVGEVAQDGESKAIFGSMSWNINDQFRATIGGRYTEDEKDAHRIMFFAMRKTHIPLPIPAIPGLGVAHDANYIRDDSDFSPSFTMEWKPADNQMYYFTYSEGFKAGGFDFSSGEADFDKVEFDPEGVKSVEVGGKTTLLDGAMELNVALFRSEFTDLQVSTFDGNLALLVGNAAEAISKGLEVDMRWALTDELTLTAALAFLDAKYDSYETAQCTSAQAAATPPGQTCIQDMTGEALTFAPDYSGSVSLSYVRVVGDGLLLKATGDVNFTDEYWVAGDADPRALADSYAKFNALLAIESASSNWEVGVLAKNLTNEKTTHWANDVPLSPGSFYTYLDRPRTVTLFARYSF
jgi:iron complex outermembrane receptor protein